MKWMPAFVALFAFLAARAWTVPTVDGKVFNGEYAHSLTLIEDTASVYYQLDAQGGLYMAVAAPTTGWVGVGLGSVVMDGAHIFMGYVKEGLPVISEQVGQGHSHDQSPNEWADASAISQVNGTTTLELHIPADRVPADRKKVGLIVAYSGSADLTTFHDDNHDGAFIDLSTSP